MKKEVKGIIALGSVLAVLGGGLAAMKLTDKSGNDNSDSGSQPALEETTTAEGSGVVLVADDGTEKSGVAKVHVKNRSDEYDVVMTEHSSGETAAKYNIKGCEELNMETGMIATIVNNVNGLESAGIIAENCSDFSKYGLDDPEISAEMTFESGKTVKYYVGIKNPGNTATSYFRIEGSSAVYLVENSRFVNYSKSVRDFISKTLLESPPDDEMPIVKTLTLEREDLDYSIVLESNETTSDSNAGGTLATHEMVEPIKAYLSVEQSSKITHGMFGLTADDIYAYLCTDDDIKNAGLDKPFCRTEMKCDDGNDYVLLLSKMQSNEDGGQFCYAMFEDGNVIYTLSEEKAVWSTVKPVDIASPRIVGSTVWNLTELSVKLGTGESKQFILTPIDPDGDNNSSEDFTATLNGKDIDYERFRLFYKYVLDADAEDLAFNEKLSGASPLVEISYSDGYLNTTKKVAFYEYSPLTVLITVDGECRFFGSRTYVDNLIENIKRLETGEEFLSTWK